MNINYIFVNNLIEDVTMRSTNLTQIYTDTIILSFNSNIK